MKVAPRPGLSVTAMVPPWASMMRLQIDDQRHTGEVDRGRGLRIGRALLDRKYLGLVLNGEVIWLALRLKPVADAKRLRRAGNALETEPSMKGLKKTRENSESEVAADRS